MGMPYRPVLSRSTYRFLIQLTYEVQNAALMKTFSLFSQICSCLLILQVIASYFPLRQCIEGLKILVESLFGVTFHGVPLAPGESWHPDVMKIVLHHPTEASLIY